MSRTIAQLENQTGSELAQYSHPELVQGLKQALIEIKRLRGVIDDAECCLVCGALGDPLEVIDTSLKILGASVSPVNTVEQRRSLAYGIGCEHSSGQIAMWHGPCTTRQEALEIDGDDTQDVIVRFSPDGTDRVMYRWSGDHWVRQI